MTMWYMPVCVCAAYDCVLCLCVCVFAALLGRSAKLFIMHSNAWTLIYAATLGAPGYSLAPFPSLCSPAPAAVVVLVPFTRLVALALK